LNYQKDKKSAFIPKGVLFTLLLSALIHILFLSLHIEIPINRKKSQRPRYSRIKVKLIKEIKAPVKEKDIKKKQIVNNELRGKKIRPKKTRFLGKDSQTFDRETVAKEIGIFKPAGKGKKAGTKTASFEEKF